MARHTRTHSHVKIIANTRSPRCRRTEAVEVGGTKRREGADRVRERFELHPLHPYMAMYSVTAPASAPTCMVMLLDWDPVPELMQRASG